MKANELRLGNYIERKDIGNNEYRIESILEITINKVTTTGPIKVILNIEDVEPIKITKEIIYNCSFDNDHWATDWILYKMPTPTKIKYLHQLQNLYFALTGTELYLKDKGSNAL